MRQAFLRAEKDVTDYVSYGDLDALERSVNAPPGSLRNIPGYALMPAVNAIRKVRDMEEASLFRSGLYYIVMADLMDSSKFNAKYGDKAGDIRIEWFHTCAITALGVAPPSNYASYLKAIGDAALLIFSSFADVVRWSDRFTAELERMYDEYIGSWDTEDASVAEMASDYKLRARRFAHVGEVRFKDGSDPICLAVTQTFKVEKVFENECLGCTEAVLNAVAPLLPELRLTAAEHSPVLLAGHSTETLTYYLREK